MTERNYRYAFNVAIKFAGSSIHPFQGELRQNVFANDKEEAWNVALKFVSNMQSELSKHLRIVAISDPAVSQVILQLNLMTGTDYVLLKSAYWRIETC